MTTRRIQSHFDRVWTFVKRRDRRLGRILLLVGCVHLERDRQRSGLAGRRAFMHVGCVPNRICVSPTAENLPTEHLVGLFLHEFGHLGSGRGEPDADLWVMQKLGIPIEYKSGLELEWVDPRLVREKGI